MGLGERSSAPASLAADGHATDAQGGGCRGAAPNEVVAHGVHVQEHVPQVAGDGDLVDGVREAAVLDPVTDGTLGVVARDDVDAEADQVGDEEARRTLRDDLLG